MSFSAIREHRFKVSSTREFRNLNSKNTINLLGTWVDAISTLFIGSILESFHCTVDRLPRFPEPEPSNCRLLGAKRPKTGDFRDLLDRPDVFEFRATILMNLINFGKLIFCFFESLNTYLSIPEVSAPSSVTDTVERIQLVNGNLQIGTIR